MNVYKLEPSNSAKIYTITTESDFVDNSKGRFPHLQSALNGHNSYFAYCPFCLNPIQIVSFSGNIRPHGKHIGSREVKGFDWDYERYKFCPYASHKKYIIINDNDRLENTDENIRFIYSLLRNNFDRVKYVIELTLKMKFSASFWSNSIIQFLNNCAYLSPHLTERNLPYVFMYYGMQHQNIYSQLIGERSFAYNSLNNYSDISLIYKYTYKNERYFCIKNSGKYVNLQLRFYRFKQKAISGQDICESAVICIDDQSSDITLIEEEFEFEQNLFLYLINKSDTYRDHTILALAYDLIKDI